jgi:hypothetical protein
VVVVALVDMLHLLQALLLPQTTALLLALAEQLQQMELEVMAVIRLF